MSPAESITGQQRAWTLIEKLGEGDAGEVFLVESLLEHKQAILKRPHRSAFSSDIVRQAAQIETEGRVLRALAALAQPSGYLSESPGVSVCTPALLDFSSPGSEYSERLFIVIERAAGVDLAALARVAQGAPLPPLPPAADPGVLLQHTAARLGRLPELLALRLLAGLIDFLEKLHSLRINPGDADYAGLLWNDVKPEHLYWDPVRQRLTVIDWGNAQFLMEDGATRDRRLSRGEDAAQLLRELGRFLEQTVPDLARRLEWPAAPPAGAGFGETLQALRARMSAGLAAGLESARQARRQEADLLLEIAPSSEQGRALHQAQERLQEFGELPDFNGAQEFTARLGARLVAEGALEEFIELCQAAAALPGQGSQRWGLLAELAAPGEAGGTPLRRALLAALNQDWAAALWDLYAVTGPGPGWEAVCARLRAMQPETENALAPRLAASRLLHQLQGELLRLEEAAAPAARPAGLSRPATAPLRTPTGSLRPGETPRPTTGPLRPAAPAPAPVASPPDPARLAQSLAPLVRRLKDDILPRWLQAEPDPPDSGLEYTDVARLAEELHSVLPGSTQPLEIALVQPRLQAGIVLDAWRRREFELARRALRRLLLWDPDRRRIFQAERALKTAPAWLDAARRGPRRTQPLPEFLAEVELGGRELRNQIGSAPWLDLILETLARLRKGARAHDLQLERPELSNELPWLAGSEPARPDAARPRQGPLALARKLPSQPPAPTLLGRRSGLLGEGGDLSLSASLDAWAPEARGSSARVFLGQIATPEGEPRAAAVKIMRPNRSDYALPLYREEALVLAAMRDVPGVAGLLECGFLRLAAPRPGGNGPANPLAALAEEQFNEAGRLSGAAQRYGPDQVSVFVGDLHNLAGQGWLPYLAVELMERKDNLVTMCDAGYTRGRFLPIKEGLRMAVQILEVLEAAHQRNIVYRDHKLLHYYWLEDANGIYVIDWNVARLHPQGLSEAERQFDLVQFAARALHHILTGRVAPGALPSGPTRVEEIEAAAHSYAVQWTYDDRRISPALRDIIERALAGGYTQAAALKDDLISSFQHLPDS